MKKIKIFPLLLLLCLVLTAAAPGAWALEDPQIPALAAVLVDLDSGRVLYEKNMDEERAPASLTKVMTVLLAFEALERGQVAMEDMVTAGTDCREGMDESSSTAGILPGMTLSFRELLYCAMISSANEACNIIASHLAGSVRAFVDQMNQRAGELGCTHTHFVNTNGLPAEGHYSSAYDLYLITREALKFPEFISICDTKTYQPTLSALNDGKPLVNSNALLTPDGAYGDQYVYEYASGVKTGYTRAAGYCLISTAEKDGLRALAVVMGSDGYLNANIDEYRNFEASIDLYDWFFDNFSYQTLLSASAVIEQAPVEFAQDGAKASLVPMESITALVPKDLAEEDVQSAVTVFEDRLVAPIAPGTVLGEVTVTVNGVDYGTVRLVNTANIALARSEYMRMRVAQVFSNRFVLISLAVLALFLLLYLILVLRYRALRRKILRQRRLAEKRRRQEAMERQYSGNTRRRR